MDLQRLKAAALKAKEASEGLNRPIIAKAAGVSFEGRQELLLSLDKETSFKLERDRRNKFDFYAVKILAYINNSWEQVGFIPKKMSQRISKSLDKGADLSVEFYRLTGGFVCQTTGETALHGLEIRINNKDYGEVYGKES